MGVRAFITHGLEYRRNNDRTVFEGKGTVGEVARRKILRAYYMSSGKSVQGTLFG